MDKIKIKVGTARKEVVEQFRYLFQDLPEGAYIDVIYFYVSEPKIYSDGAVKMPYYTVKIEYISKDDRRLMIGKEFDDIGQYLNFCASVLEIVSKKQQEDEKRKEIAFEEYERKKKLFDEVIMGLIEKFGITVIA